jgi:hypothetical protein
MNAEERKETLDTYSRAGGELAEALKGFPRSMWTYKPGPDRWSIREILHHLADSEANGYIRCRRAVAEPGQSVMAYDQEKWVAGLRHQDQDAQEAVKLFKLMRAINARLLKSLPPEAWANTMDHPEHGLMTLDDWLVIYTAHTPAHIEQMKATHAAWVASQQGKSADPDKSLYQQPKR